MRKKATVEMLMSNIARLLVVAIILILMANVVNMGASVNAAEETKSKALEIRNALIYLNSVEEGTRIILLPTYYKFEVILAKDNISVICHRSTAFGGDINIVRQLSVIPKDAILPNTVKDVRKICLSKKITNCQNIITICEIEDVPTNCCQLEDLEDTLCTSSNQYLK